MRMKRFVTSSLLLLVCALAWPVMADVDNVCDAPLESVGLLQIDDLAVGTTDVVVVEPERLRGGSSTFSNTEFVADMTAKGARIDRYDKTLS